MRQDAVKELPILCEKVDRSYSRLPWSELWVQLDYRDFPPSIGIFPLDQLDRLVYQRITAGLSVVPPFLDTFLPQVRENKDTLLVGIVPCGTLPGHVMAFMDGIVSDLPRSNFRTQIEMDSVSLRDLRKKLAKKERRLRRYARGVQLIED